MFLLPDVIFIFTPSESLPITTEPSIIEIILETLSQIAVLLLIFPEPDLVRTSWSLVNLPIKPFPETPVSLWEFAELYPLLFEQLRLDY